jgi:hypothetical protein
VAFDFEFNGHEFYLYVSIIKIFTLDMLPLKLVYNLLIVLVAFRQLKANNLNFIQVLPLIENDFCSFILFFMYVSCLCLIGSAHAPASCYWCR